MQSMVNLYHFTCREHLSSILNDGFLETTDGVISQTQSKPMVVWLTTSPDAGEGLGLQLQNNTDKRAIRFEVRVPKSVAKKWREWALANRSDPEFMKKLSSIGGGSSTWRVVQRRILRSEWVRVTDMDSGDDIPFSSGL